MTLISVLKDYLIHSTFHGLRFIAEDGRHWTERLFWGGWCLASWLASAALIRSSWLAFQHNAISFVAETRYLRMDTPFPAVSVCEDDNMDSIYRVANEFFSPNHDSNLEEVLKEIAFFKGSVYYIKEFCLSENLQCPTKDYKKVAEKVRSTCEQIFHSCSWKNKTFDCCSHFVPVETEWGTCFTLSQRFENKMQSEPLDLRSSSVLGLGFLHVELHTQVKIYLHNEADIPYYNTMTTDILTLKPSLYKRSGLTILGIENDPEVQQLSVSQRGCRFPDESELVVSDVYSYSACVTECRMHEQLRHCNCTSHLMPHADESMHCDIMGVLCLTRNHERMSVQRTAWGNKEGLSCPCLPGCQDVSFTASNAATHSLKGSDKENLSMADIYLNRLPTQRFKRNVVRGRLDLVGELNNLYYMKSASLLFTILMTYSPESVSMGGTAGLFVGASILSFAEFLYYFTVRLCITNKLDEVKRKKARKMKQAQAMMTPIPNSVTLYDQRAQALHMNQRHFKRNYGRVF